MSADRDTFLQFSAVLTGYTATDLEGTGLVSPFLDALNNILGADIAGELLQAASTALGSADQDAAIQELWHSPKLGPVVQNLIRLWYVGSWTPLPAQWQYTYTPNRPDPHGSAYWPVPQQGFMEGLMWRTIHAHPPGAKPGGFASWTEIPATAKPGIAIVAVSGGGSK